MYANYSSADTCKSLANTRDGELGGDLRPQPQVQNSYRFYLAYTLFSEKPFFTEPVGEAIDPVIARQMLGLHAEAVATFGIHMEFGRFAGTRPMLVEAHAIA